MEDDLTNQFNGIYSGRGGQGDDKKDEEIRALNEELKALQTNIDY